MPTVEEQLENINNKDDLIKWLVNEYYFHSYKLDLHKGKENALDPVSHNERKQVREKADEIMEGRKTKQKARKKPVEIEFMQFTGIESGKQIERWSNNKARYKTTKTARSTLLIDTMEGTMVAELDDYIIKGVHNEFYACKPDVFHKTYEVL